VGLEGQLIAAAERIATLSRLCFGTSSEEKGKEKGEAEYASASASGKPADPCRPPDNGCRRRGQRPGSTVHGLAAEDFTLWLGDIGVVYQKEAADEGLHPAATKVLATLDHDWEGVVCHAG